MTGSRTDSTKGGRLRSSHPARLTIKCVCASLCDLAGRPCGAACLRRHARVALQRMRPRAPCVVLRTCTCMRACVRVDTQPNVGSMVAFGAEVVLGVGLMAVVVVFLGVAFWCSGGCIWRRGRAKRGLDGCAWLRGRAWRGPDGRAWRGCAGRGGGSSFLCRGPWSPHPTPHARLPLTRLLERSSSALARADRS